MTNFTDREQQQELQMQQQEQPQSPFPIGLCFGESPFPIVCETPFSAEDEQTRNSWSPPPIVTKTGHHDVTTPKAYVVAPCGTPPSQTITTHVKKTVLRRKRQRPRSLPPMIPGSPELYNTSDSNPFGRHVPIHSPILGIDHTLDLRYIRKLESSKEQRRQTSDSSRCSTKIEGERRSSIESSDLSYSSDDSAGIFGFQTFLPALEDSKYDNDAAFGKGKEEQERIFSSATRALKMRRRDCSQSNQQDVFEPTTYVT